MTLSRGCAAWTLVALFACGTEPPCPAAALPPLAERPAFAVVTTDYISTSIALLDAEGALLDEGWVDSGSAEAGIVAALSGDVTLPSEPLAPGELTLIDRFGVDVVSRFGLSTGSVIGQVSTQLPPEAGGAGFRANPQDVVSFDGELLISRSEPNFDPMAPELDRGNDLVFVNDDGPHTRVPFDGLDVLPSAGAPRVYARPGRISRLGDALVIGLERSDADFMSGEGAVAVVTGDPPIPRALPIPRLANCVETRSTEDGSSVFVLCAGETFRLPDERRQSAGLARLSSVMGEIVVDRVWRASDHPDGPVPSGAPIPLDDGRVVFSAPDEIGETDALIVLDVTTSELSVAYRTAGSFVLGTGVWVPEAALLLVPHAEEGVLRFEVGGAPGHRGITLVDHVDVSPCRGLSARHVGALLP